MSILDMHFEDVVISDAQQAIIDATCLAIMADGKITEDEEAHAIQSISALLGVDGAHASALVQRSFARIEGGSDAVLVEIGARVHDSQEIEAVFTAAAFVAFQDGGMYLDEQAFLIQLADTLNLSDEERDYLVDVVRERFDEQLGS